MINKQITNLSLIALLTGLLLFGIATSSKAQQAVGINNSNPDASSILDITSTTQGILIPRMTTAQRDAIAAPATGLMVFVNSDNNFYFYNGTTWELFNTSGSDNDWTEDANGDFFNTSSRFTIGTAPALPITSSRLEIFETGTNNALLARTTGTEGTGFMVIDNPSNSSDALSAITNGSGDAFNASTIGSGRAGNFGIFNFNNSSDVLNASTNGLGRAGFFEITNSNNIYPALEAMTNGNGTAFLSRTTGFGEAGYFGINNPNNITTALNAVTNGRGPALYVQTTGLGFASFFRIDNPNNPGVVIEASTNGTGTAGNFVINNTMNSKNALQSLTTGSGNSLDVLNTGTGKAGNFEIINPSNSSNVLDVNTNGSGNALDATTTGTGSAGYFEINNLSNPNNALEAVTNGSGTAIIARTTGNGNGVRASAFGNGTAFIGSTTGTGKAGFFEINNPSNSNDALHAFTTGTGSAFRALTTGGGIAGIFSATNSSSSSSIGVSTYSYAGTAVRATTISGIAGSFITTDPTNLNDALNVRTSGIGLAGRFEGGNVQIEGNGAKRLIIQSNNNNEATLDLINQGFGTDWRINSKNNLFLSFEKSTDDLSTSVGVLDLIGGTPNSLEPATALGVQLGSLAFRYTALYAQNGTIQTSDKSFKKNIKDLNYGLNSVMKMRPVSFDWKNTEQEKSNLGFIAQEIEQIVPEVIVKEKPKNKDGSTKPGEDIYGMKYSELIPVLVKAIQEQQAMIEKLEKSRSEEKAKVEILEKEIKELKVK